MNTLQRLRDNETEYDNMIAAYMDEARTRLLQVPYCLRWLLRRKERNQLRQLREQRDMVRARYYLLREDARRLIYHA